jgi:hypothetical protein
VDEVDGSTALGHARDAGLALDQLIRREDDSPTHKDPKDRWQQFGGGPPRADEVDKRRGAGS